MSSDRSPYPASPPAPRRGALAPTPAALPLCESSAQLARGIVREALAARLDSQSAQTAELLTTELVSNAVRHASQSCQLIVTEKAGGRVRIAVSDDSCQPPAPVTPSQPDDDESECGRGLFLVGALSAEWDATPTVNGKIVWFELDDTA